jgi:hypothetical protein
MIEFIKLIIFVLVLSLGLYVLFEVSGMFDDDLKLTKITDNSNNSNFAKNDDVYIINVSFLKDPTKSEIRLLDNHLLKSDIDKMIYREERTFKIPLNSNKKTFKILANYAIKIKANVMIVNYYETRRIIRVNKPTENNS